MISVNVHDITLLPSKVPIDLLFELTKQQPTPILDATKAGDVWDIYQYGPLFFQNVECFFVLGFGRIWF